MDISVLYNAIFSSASLKSAKIILEDKGGYVDTFSDLLRALPSALNYIHNMQFKMRRECSNMLK